MPTNYTPSTTTWPTTIQIPSDGDDANAASIAASIQGLGDRTQSIFEGRRYLAPPSISGSQAAYNPTGWDTASLVLLTASAPATFHGFVIGAQKLLANTSIHKITIAHQSVTEVTAARRVQCPYDRDFVIAPGCSASLFYDDVATRWRVVSDVNTSGDLAWTGTNSFAPAAAATPGLTATGTTSGAGIVATGGTSGRGATLAAGGGNNAGASCTGTGTGEGVFGHGAGTGSGVIGQGAATAAGVIGIVTGVSVPAQTGEGVLGAGLGTSSGVKGLGGSGGGAGVRGQGGGTNAVGVVGAGAGTGAGVLGTGGSNAPGVIGAGNGNWPGVLGAGGGTQAADIMCQGGRPDAPHLLLMPGPSMLPAGATSPGAFWSDGTNLYFTNSGGVVKVVQWV